MSASSKVRQFLCFNFKSRIQLDSSKRWLILHRNFGQPAAETHPHLLKKGEVTPGILKDEYKRRRLNLFNLAKHTTKSLNIPDNHLIILPSASKVFMSSDIPYTFRQNTDFLYMCGFLEPDSLLLIHGLQEAQSVLFVPQKDPVKELWDGPRSGRLGALELTGVDVTLNSDDLEKHLYDYCVKHPSHMIWYNHSKPVNTTFHEKVISSFIKSRGDGRKNLESPSNLIQKQRLTKSSSEIDLMAKSVEIASYSFAEVMKFSYPGVKEAHLYAKMDFECRMRDADYLAYPPVVAGGDRANIIHYIQNNQIVYKKELVLMDAGCEYHGYTSDLTRTWPVSGKYTDSQKDVYNSVLHIQQVCISLCKQGSSLDEIYLEMVNLLGTELKKLGIVSEGISSTELNQTVKQYCPHHVGHYLGMDVHDTANMSRSLKFRPGMIVTIEPGLYFPSTDEKIPAIYRGIGIRIEDNILITDSDPFILSHMCPKTVDEIEKLMADRKR